MTCPVCASPFPDEPHMVGNMTVCQNPECARTIAKDGWRAATADDLEGISDADRALLRSLRPAAWRANTKARLTEIRGRAR